MKRRILLGALAAPSLAQAQWVPARPVRLVVPFPAGGSPDLLARLMAPSVSAALGQNVVVENRTGAGGTIAAEAVALTELVAGRVSYLIDALPPAIAFIGRGIYALYRCGLGRIALERFFHRR